MFYAAALYINFILVFCCNNFYSDSMYSTLENYLNLTNTTVFRGLRTIDALNSFPAICYYTLREQRRHIGGGIRYADIYIQIRGYVYGENSNQLAEDLAESIEQRINAFGEEQCSIGVQQARVVSIRTDEGLFEPYGILDMTIYIERQLS